MKHRHQGKYKSRSCKGNIFKKKPVHKHRGNLPTINMKPINYEQLSQSDLKDIKAGRVPNLDKEDKEKTKSDSFKVIARKPSKETARREEISFWNNVLKDGKRNDDKDMEINARKQLNMLGE
jgi:hypothetical protein